MQKKHYGGFALKERAHLNADAIEIEANISREEAKNKQFGFQLFYDGQLDAAFPVALNTTTEAIRVGKTETPFLVGNLPADEDVDVRIFIDKYIVEVFVNRDKAVC